jgi:molybdopterin synthase catalytic subunit
VEVSLREGPFDPWNEINRHAGSSGFRPADYGATAVFVGTMRDFNEGAAVTEMFLEHYPGMTERCLASLVTTSLEASGAGDALVVHRVGRITPGEVIVLVAVWSAHRAQAFAGCRTIMEQLKHTAPFWKREQGPDGSRWVESNTPGELPVPAASATEADMDAFD